MILFTLKGMPVTSALFFMRMIGTLETAPSIDAPTVAVSKILFVCLSV